MASTGIRTRVCATIHLTAAIFEMAMKLFLRHRRVQIKIIKITFIQNQLQAVPMSKVFEKSKKETKKRTRLQIKNTKLVSVMLFTTTTRNKKLDFYCSFVTKKKSQQTPNKIEEDLKKDGLLPALTKNNCQFCRNAISN